MSEIVFSTFGAASEAELNPQKPVVYQAARRFIVSRPEAGQDPASSTLIPREITGRLKEINGKFLLSRYKTDYRNINLYSPDAVTVDGANRICYLSYDEKEKVLLVSEAGSIRNSGYSALFREFAKRLEQAGFDRENGPFRVTPFCLDSLIQAANALIQDKLQGQLELRAVPETEVLCMHSNTGKSVPYYYYKAYWFPKSGDAPAFFPSAQPQAQVPASEETYLKTIDANIKGLAEFCRQNNDMEKAKSIGAAVQGLYRKLETLEKLNETNISLLEMLQNF